MNAVMELDWTSANQRLLTAEFTRLRALLHDGKVAEANSQVKAMQAQLTAPASIDTLTQLFQLSTFERDILLLVAGVEMDAQLATLCGEASGRPQRPWASFGLALAALPNPHWSAIAPVQALRRWRLMEVDESTGLTSGRLKLDERVLHYIGGLNYLDHRLSPLLAEAATAGFMAEAHLTIASRATTELQNLRDRLPVVMLCGNDQHGRQDVAATVARKLGVSLYRLRAADIPATPHEQDSLAQLWQREAALLGSGLLVTYTGDDSSPAVARFITKVDGLVFTSGLKAPQIDTQSLRYEINKVEAPDQRQLWYNALGEKAESLTDALDGLSSQYRLSAHRIAGVAGQIEGKDSSRDIATLHRLCRSDDTGMNELAQSIETRATWNDLVLPEHQQRMLRQIAVHVNHRITVYHDWGFAHKSSRGLGIATLFYGESGTGKTLAAEVLANTLGLALYRIDLSTVVSKYIGETEKNLRKVFDAAENIGAILLFDEADALFGRRSEVKDSHDRYANIEVSYLLQRMENYLGLAILTTNHKSALDTAFQRRLRFVMHFPFPNVVQRDAIWRSIFPANTPLEDLDYAKLARLNATGGNIHNIALGASFLAAEAGTPVTMAHLLRAAHIEAAKGEKSPSDAEIRGWA